MLLLATHLGYGVGVHGKTGMLVRQTFLYLPAQILPALFQFLALVVWSHFTTAEVIGIVTLFSVVQELLNVAFVGGWNLYVVRFSGKHSETYEGRERLRATSTIVVLTSLLVQVIVALLIFYLSIDEKASGLTAIVLSVLVASRALNLVQSDRGRARGDILLYSVAVMSGPILGFLIGLLLLSRFGDSYLWIFLGFAIAQVAGTIFGIGRDSTWIGFGRPDVGLIRHAFAYSAPLVLSSIVAWVTQNAARIAVSYVFGLSAAGIFGLGFGLGFRASMVAALSVAVAAFSIAVRLSNAGDIDGALRQLSTNGGLLLGILCPTLVGLAFVSHDLIKLLLAVAVQDEIYPILLWSLPASAFICIRQYFLNQVFLLKGRTRPIALIAALEAVAAVVLAIMVVPRWGGVGGAISLSITSAASMVATLPLALRLGLVIPWRDARRIPVATLAMSCAILLVPSSQDVATLALRIAVGSAVYIVTMIVLYRSDVSLLLEKTLGKLN